MSTYAVGLDALNNSKDCVALIIYVHRSFHRHKYWQQTWLGTLLILPRKRWKMDESTWWKYWWNKICSMCVFLDTSSLALHPLFATILVVCVLLLRQHILVMGRSTTITWYGYSWTHSSIALLIVHGGENEIRDLLIWRWMRVIDAIKANIL